ncbi:MAG: 30S ribosomal protein S13 [Actinomycetaceae bacterium]|nr:30S ribosomal protein S13 [Actinomycetaceae bacterium]
MALPNLTPEQRAAALEKAAIARRERATLKKQLKAGEVKVSEVVEKAKKDDIVGKLKVTALLSSLPGVGQAKTAAIMEQVEISQSRRVAGLGPHQARALIDMFG